MLKYQLKRLLYFSRVTVMPNCLSVRSIMNVIIWMLNKFLFLKVPLTYSRETHSHFTAIRGKDSRNWRRLFLQCHNISSLLHGNPPSSSEELVYHYDVLKQSTLGLFFLETVIIVKQDFFSAMPSQHLPWILLLLKATLFYIGSKYSN